MNPNFSPNTQAILLLTAPLIAGRSEPSPDLLTPGQYKSLARHLHQLAKEPADLLASGAEDILRDTQSLFDPARIKRLLARGFALSQAIERWQSRAIWVVSRADPDYPQCLRERLKDDRPAVLYGCGDRSLLESGGLAVVGSRKADERLIEYTQDIGRLAAKSRKTLVSGGARGIDQAAMRGALEAGGRVAGVMADGLEKAAMDRDNRSLLMEGQLVLVSPFDPAAGFNVGNAMQRNKLIYALADAALVVNADFEKGGTWAGAVEQLSKFHFVPVFVRSDGQANKALLALQAKGALSWPNPADTDGFIDAMENPSMVKASAETQAQLTLTPVAEPQIAQPNTEEQSEGEVKAISTLPASAASTDESNSSIAAEDDAPPTLEPSPVVQPAFESPADALFSVAKQSILRVLDSPKKAGEIAEELRLSETQVKAWIALLIEAGAIEKTKRHTYQIRAADLIDLCTSLSANESGSKP